jgi:hypothetical protein
MNMTEAAVLCRSALLNSSVYAACANIGISFDLEVYVSACATDVAVRSDSDGLLVGLGRAVREVLACQGS